LLLEDLFRIYEQVENNKEISLRPVPKTYTAFINKTAPRADSHLAPPSEWPTRPAADRPNGTAISGQPQIPCVEIASKTIPIEPKHERALFSDTVKAFGLKPEEVLLAAITRSVFKTRGADVIAMDLSIDQRLLDPTLAQTVGALTRMDAMSDAIIEDC